MTNARELVCSIALTWLGTPYHHHARIKGVGVDCVHLICAVTEAAGVAPPIDPGWYERTWHLSRNEELYMHELDRWAQRTDEPRPGDIVLFKYGRTYSHAGIMLPGGEVVHALNRGVHRGSVVQTHIEQAPLAGRSPLFWDIDTVRAVPLGVEG